ARRQRRRRPPAFWKLRRSSPSRNVRCLARCERELVAQLFGVLRARLRVRLQIGIEQLRELLDLRGLHLRARGRGLGGLAVVSGALPPAGPLQFNAAARRPVLLVGLGGLLRLGVELLLPLRLALLLAPL